MTDIHAHLLPGIDDGAADIYETLDMLAIAAESGTRTIVATPHANLRRYYENYYGEWYEDLLHTVREAVRREQIPVAVLSGMEVCADRELRRLLGSGDVITLNRSRYLLMEFDFGIEPDEAALLIDDVTRCGLVPVIAHAERYDCVADNPETVRRWMRRGALLQLNSGSITGSFGRRVRHTAYALLDRHYPSVIASDAHSPRTRSPYMSTALEMLAEEYPQQYLLELFSGNPRAIVENRPLTNRLNQRN